VTDTTVAIKEVAVRGWPERTTLQVIDIAAASELFCYDVLKLDSSDPIFSPKFSAAEREQAALDHLALNQDILLRHYGYPQGALVRLELDGEPKLRLERVLRAHDLTLDGVEFSRCDAVLDYLNKIPIDNLWDLYCDWWDVAERHYPIGSARAQHPRWFRHATPSVANYWAGLAGGDSERALQMFREYVDQPLERINFMLVIQYAYFLRTEFSQKSRFPLRALS